MVYDESREYCIVYKSLLHFVAMLQYVSLFVMLDRLPLLYSATDRNSPFEPIRPYEYNLYHKSQPSSSSHKIHLQFYRSITSIMFGFQGNDSISLIGLVIVVDKCDRSSSICSESSSSSRWEEHDCCHNNKDVAPCKPRSEPQRRLSIDCCPNKPQRTADDYY